MSTLAAVPDSAPEEDIFASVPPNTPSFVDLQTIAGPTIDDTEMGKTEISL